MGRKKAINGFRITLIPQVPKLENVSEHFESNSIFEEYDENSTFTAPQRPQKHSPKAQERDANLHKYWLQRYSYFSKLDEGILIDREGWYSVTPEVIASHIASWVPRKATVLDGFCGVAGNSIAFARRGCRVTAVELDRSRLRLAINNSRVYHTCIKFVHGDYCQQVLNSTYDVVFLSPPWGGPSYQSKDVFRLADIQLTSDGQTVDGFEIFRLARAASPNVIYFLPRNTSILDIASLAPKFYLEQHWLDGKFKAITVYTGPLFQNQK